MKNTKDKGYILAYDICQLPEGMTIRDVVNFLKKENKCYYDSSKGSNYIPKIIHLGGDKNKKLLDVEFIDTKN